MSVAFAAVFANVGFIGCMYYRPITEVLYPPNEWKLQIGDVRIASSTSTLEDTEQATCKVCGCSVVNSDCMTNFTHEYDNTTPFLNLT